MKRVRAVVLMRKLILIPLELRYALYYEGGGIPNFISTIAAVPQDKNE
jgi:hypothetical protein